MEECLELVGLPALVARLPVEGQLLLPVQLAGQQQLQQQGGESVGRLQALEWLALHLLVPWADLEG